jgi:hypothetical protein
MQEIGAFFYKVVMGAALGHTSAMFIGIPTVLAISLVLSPTPKSATGSILRGMSLALLIVAPLVGEGYPCILFASPLFLLASFVCLCDFAYGKRSVTISTNYNTVNVLRTMEDLLGIDHLNFRDADAVPMADVFIKTPNFTPYTAIVPGDLCTAPSIPNCSLHARAPRRRSHPPRRSCTTPHGGRRRQRVSISLMLIVSMPMHSTASCGKAIWVTTCHIQQCAAGSI